MSRMGQVEKLRAVIFRDRLMTKANSKNGNAAGVPIQDPEHLGEFVRQAGTRREDDAGVATNVIEIDVVVSYDRARAFARFADKLREVVREGIAIIDEQNL
jgi:hypothetical protein